MRHVDEFFKREGYAIREIVAYARRFHRGEELIKLHIGDPSLYGFQPPEEVVKAFREATEKKLYGYAPSQGDLELRERIAERENLSAEDIFITHGLTEAISVLIELTSKGKAVALESPTYSLYPYKAKQFNAEIRTFSNFSREELEKAITEDVTLTAVVNPSNPTGETRTEEELKNLLKAVKGADTPLFYDSAYEGICFSECPNIKSLHRGEMLIYGFSMSKVALYPGLRIGYIALHGEFEWLKPYLAKALRGRLSLNWEAQKAALAFFENNLSFPKEALKEVKRRAEHAYRLAKEIGLKPRKPNGAFYMWVNYSETTNLPSMEFAKALAKETAVTVVPAEGFLSKERAFRIVTLADEETMTEAFSRIERFLSK